MDGSSDTETIVEESVDQCDSPSILTGLSQIRRMSQTHQPLKSRGLLEKISRAFVTSASSPSGKDDSGTHSSRDDTSFVDLSQSSEKSQSIFTQRVSAKRKSPILTVPPSSSQGPSLKIPRSADDSLSIDTHLAVQSSSFGIQADHGQVASFSSSLALLLNEQTQATVTNISPVEQKITWRPNHPEASQWQTTNSVTVPERTNLVKEGADQLGVQELASRNRSPGLTEATPPSVPTLSQRQAIAMPEAIDSNLITTLPTLTPLSPEAQDCHTVFSSTSLLHQGSFLKVKGSEKDEDDDSLFEVEKMQREIREKLSSKDADVKYTEQVKKSLQDVQARLRRLSARQRDHRHQLNIKLKQQATAPSNKQQQQEARTQLQNMTRRQQHLLKLLQSHKELTVSLQWMQHAKHPLPVQNEVSGQSRSVNDSTLEVEPTGTKQSSSPKIPSINSFLPDREAMLMSNDKAAIPASSNPLSAQTSGTKIPSKPASDISSGRNFKPPFKANTAKSPNQPVPPSSSYITLNLQRDEANSVSVADIQDRAQSIPRSAVRDKSPEPITEEKISPKSPPYLPWLSPDKSFIEPSKEQSKDSHQAAIPLQTEGLPVALVTDHYATSQGTTLPPGFPSEPLSITHLSTQAGNTTETAPSTSRSPALVSPVPKTPHQSSIQISTVPTDCKRHGDQLPTQLSNKDPGSPKSLKAPGSTPSSQPRQMVVYKINASTVKDLQKRNPSKTSLDAVIAGMPGSSSTVQTSCQVDSVTGSTQLLSNTTCLSSPSSSCCTVAAATRTNIPSNSDILSPPGTVEVTTAGLQSQMDVMTQGEATGLSACQTRAPSDPQGTAEVQAQTGSQGRTTVVDSSSQKNKTLPNHNRRAHSTEEEVPSLQNLLQERLIQPGENVLLVKLKRKAVSASLTIDGTVRPTTVLKNFTCGSLHQLVSMVQHKSISWIRKNPSIWKSVLYKDKPLEQLHADYKALLARDHQFQSQQVAVKQNTQATATTNMMTTHASVHVPPTSGNHTSSAHAPPRRQTLVSTGLDLSSQSGVRVARSSDLTSAADCDITTSLSNSSPIRAGLASSMEKVLLISDGELMPAPWGVSSDNTQNSSIPQEWIDEIDIWT
ncbi:uncharacterized protein LOC110976591 [Acanthaster planci]|uniref:Uncharacterized protein LOC110976591 n=1 Tax=Acanthaster planci TaxID=133434 RepID=A0A8B7Y141_ACAPL|nr:uncharacterized protein LOC110976591 [Acanthaster planci]